VAVRPAAVAAVAAAADGSLFLTLDR
jgi:hypothetical protein